jgi:hypothetical protein
MRPDEIDEALRRQPAWEPPAGFARKVAALAPPLLDPPFRVLDIPALVPGAVRGITLECAARFAGWRWTLQQYWLLLAR